jgi:membrane-bound inhibitor of C-type lysozyme
MPSPFKTAFIAISTMSLLASCSSINLNPFNSSKNEGASGPQNAITYVCEGNKQFYVRMLNNSNEAWLIYPTHEVALTKEKAGNTYTSGAITLALNGDQSTLNDGDKIAYTGCKSLVKK